ncbi:MAG: hypothetical protein ABWK00_01890 [Desulfurococcaceae archaeon]
MSRAREVVEDTAYGLIEGALYYLIYFVLLPYALAGMPGLQASPYPFASAPLAVLYMATFIALGIASRHSPPPISAVLEAILALLGILALAMVLGSGSLQIPPTSYGGYEVSGSVDLSPLVLLIVGAAVFFGLTRVFDALSKLGEEVQ